MAEAPRRPAVPHVVYAEHALVVGVARLATLVVPGRLGVQEGRQFLLFVAFGLGVPLAMMFSPLRRRRELPWVVFGRMVRRDHHALRRMRERKGK